MIVKKRPILRSVFCGRPYLKCQVILDFEQQCRLIESHCTQGGPSALCFSRQGASILVEKLKIKCFSPDRSKEQPIFQLHHLTKAFLGSGAGDRAFERYCRLLKSPLIEEVSIQRLLQRPQVPPSLPSLQLTGSSPRPINIQTLLKLYYHGTGSLRLFF